MVAWASLIVGVVEEKFAQVGGYDNIHTQPICMPCIDSKLYVVDTCDIFSNNQGNRVWMQYLSVWYFTQESIHDNGK